MLNLVIPMAGHGKRFKQAGFDLPKPFISVEGVPMLQKVIENLAPPRETKLIVICLQKDYQMCSDVLEKTCSEWDFDWMSYVMVAIPEVTDGQACTVLKAERLINNGDELFIANSDQLILQPYYLQESLRFFRLHQVDGGIICFYQNHPKWSYVELNQEGEVLRVVEKEVVSNFATVGIYYYKRGMDFVDNAQQMIAENRLSKGEFYVAPVYNLMIERYNKAKVLPWLVNDVYGLGCPEDLQKYLERMNL